MTPTQLEADVLLILGKGLFLMAILVPAAGFLLRGSSAQTISLFWRTVLSGLILIPVVAVFLPWLRVEASGLKSDPPLVAEAGPGVVVPVQSGGGDESVVQGGAELIAETVEVVAGTGGAEAVGTGPLEVEGDRSFALLASHGDWRPLLTLGLWLLGALVVLGRWVVSWVHVARLAHAGQSIVSAGWQRELRTFGKVGARLRLIRSERCVAPVVFGMVRPVLLLPQDADTWSEGQVRQVLAHELSHVRRADPFFLFLTRLAVALHWMNPLVWMAAKRLRLADERSADDAVLARGSDPAEYASLLTDFARRGLAAPRRMPLVAPSMASPSTVRTRVQRVLDGRQLRGAPHRITRVILGLWIGAGVLVIGGLTVNPAQAHEPEEHQPTGAPEAEAGPLERNEIIWFKSRNITIPIVDFQETTLAEAVDFLRSRSRELDQWEPDPTKKGINFVIVGGELAQRQIPSLKLRNVPLEGVLELVCELTGSSSQVGLHSITIRENAPKKGRESSLLASGPVGEEAPVLMAKLKDIVVPVVQFEDVSLEEAIDFLRQRSRELDRAEIPAEQKGLNFVIRGKGIGERKIPALMLKNVPLATVLSYVCKQTRTTFKVTEVAVAIVDAASPGAQELVTRTWRVPPDFPGMLAQQKEKDPFAAVPEARNVKPLIELLRAKGISLGKEASATYIAASSQLIVRATPANLELVDALVEQCVQGTPSMIKVRLELYDVPKAKALAIVKGSAEKNEASGAYAHVQELVKAGTANLLSSPTTMLRPGQRGSLKSGSALDYIAAYQEKDGKDVPVVKHVLVGSEIEIETNMGADERTLDIRLGLYFSRGEPRTVTRQVKAPVSGREVDVETVLIDALTLSNGITTLAGQTQLLGTMQSSKSLDAPNEIMVFLTAHVTKAMK